MATRKQASTATVEDIKSIIAMWPDYSVAEIANKLGRKQSSVYNLVKLIRNHGYDLPTYAGVTKKTKPRETAIIAAINELKLRK